MDQAKIKPKKILIYHIGYLGDTLISLPSFDLIFSKNFDSKIYLLTNLTKSKVSSFEILRFIYEFSNVYKYKKGLFDLIKLVLKIRSEKFDQFYNLGPLRESFISRLRDYVFFKYILNIKIIHGKNLDLNSRIRNGSLQEWKRLYSIVDDDINNKIDQKRILWPLNSYQKLVVESLINELNPDGEDMLVGVCPGSKMTSKRWSINSYIELLSKISKSSKVKFIFFGDEYDSDLCRYLAENFKGLSISVAGVTGINESAELLRQCVLYLGNDTGAMHLAASVGTPCIAIFSARDKSGKWNPIGLNNRVIRKKVYCEHCMLEVCNNDNLCLNSISVNDVYIEWESFCKSLKKD